MVDRAVDHFGGLHMMVNNAGVGGAATPFLDDDFSDFDRVMAVNILGVLVGSQRAARHMATTVAARSSTSRRSAGSTRGAA